MKLYEIQNAILDCIDEETGEVLDIEKLEALQIEKNTKIENLALWYKNLLSDAEQLKAEKEKFAQREKATKNKAESIKAYINNILAGEQFKTTKVICSYRNSEALVIDDIKLIQSDFIKYGEPTADKDAIKKALKSGQQIDGVHIESRKNISIK